MQTFLPYPSFSQSAASLDRARLGKQRVECKQILNALDGRSKGWVNHPAVKMWRSYEQELALYGKIVCITWINRGYNDSLLDFFEERFRAAPDVMPPKWLGNPDFHRSHMSNLIRKLPEHYRPIFGPDVPDNLPYIWPVP